MDEEGLELSSVSMNDCPVMFLIARSVEHVETVPEVPDALVSVCAFV